MNISQSNIKYTHLNDSRTLKIQSHNVAVQNAVEKARVFDVLTSLTFLYIIEEISMSFSNSLGQLLKAD